MDYPNFQGPYGYDNNMYHQQKTPQSGYKGNQWSYGYPTVTPGMPPHNFVGQWAPPGNMGGTFPKKSRPGMGFNGRANKRPHQMPKPINPTGKTPAMLLHELFKDITEKYDEIAVSNQTKRYKCVLTVNEQEFEMEGSSKKAAKQKTAEVVIRTLRPELALTPYEDNSSSNQSQQPQSAYENFVQHPYAMDPSGFVPPPLPPPPAPKKSGPPAKKAKVAVPAVDSALSIVDAIRKLCVERAAEGPYNPVFEFEEVSDQENVDKFKKKYICIFSFPEKNIKYTAEGIGRSTPKDIVCLKALKEVFGVTEAQIRAIMKRNIMGKGGEMPVVQTLYHVANLCHCSLSFKIDPVEPSIGIGTGKQMGYVCELTLTDMTQNEPNTVVLKSKVAQSKHEAKEEVSLNMLKQHFDIDPANMTQTTQAAPPCQQLQVLCAKKFKKNDNVRFEDLGTVGMHSHTSFAFKFKCVVDGREFFAVGPTKKEAKNNAASEALRVLFENPQPHTTSSECKEITTYIKCEWRNMCNFFNLYDDGAATTFFASFVFVNSQGRKRIASLAASTAQFNTGHLVPGSRGTVLHHTDPIVLARRAFVRYLIKEIKMCNEGAESLILEKGSDDLFRLRSDIKVMLYATYPPSVMNSKLNTENACLTLVGSGPTEPSGLNGQTMDEILQTKNLKSHSVSDKIFKWTHIGIQGALLTTLMHPILLDRIYFGTSSFDFSDEDYHHSFFDRITPTVRDVRVEQFQEHIPHYIGGKFFIYCRPDAEENKTVEFLNHEGRTWDNKPSIVCKALIYKEFLDVNSNIPRNMPYQSAKSLATLYNKSKEVIYEQLVNKGYGQWHSRPSELSDFSLSDETAPEKKVGEESKPIQVETKPTEIDFSLDSDL